MAQEIPIIIPSLQPDQRLLELLEQLKDTNENPVILVDDGSGVTYQRFFRESQERYGCKVLKHAVNLGKGRALKDAFNYCLNKYPDMIGCVTADSDGQHTPSCIKKCSDMLRLHPDSLVLGVRDFDTPNVPSKSRWGNKITAQTCKFLCGVSVSDTQTGLRAIPKAFMAHLLSTPGERFEFETRMLIEAKDFCSIEEVQIDTVYDSKDNHSTHFDPIRDSLRIYRILGSQFMRFLLSSVSSSVIDLVLFSFFCGVLQIWIHTAAYAGIATIAARIISAIYNYSINYIFVFRNKKGRNLSGVKYFVLAFVQMCCSALLVSIGVFFFPGCKELLIKIPVDVFLFLVSYVIQRELVY